MINIERNILCSVLENAFVSGDEKIQKEFLNPDFFTSPNNKLFVKSVNRLRELGEPICSDMVRLKLISAKKWNFYLEEDLAMIMKANAFGGYEIFMDYYNVLKKNHTDSHKFRQIRDI